VRGTAPRSWALALRRPYEPLPEPVTWTAKAREFQRGYIVTFDDRDGRGVTGVIALINRRVAKIGTGNGGNWRVSFHIVFDI